MRFLESIVNAPYWLYSAVIIVIGLGIIILAFMNPPIQPQIALGLIGLGFITLGLPQVKREQDIIISKEKFDIIVIGGGLAGVCAAISAGRHGVKTAIIQDRPVFGGNASSEIRVPPGGANMTSAWARETGIIEEILAVERSCNHDIIAEGTTNSIMDLTLYSLV